MTSLRERFIDANKKRSTRYDGLPLLSGNLAAHAAGLRKALEQLVIRAEAGQHISSSAYDPALRETFKSTYSGHYSSDYRQRRDLPSREEMEALPGYQKLLEACADPAVDVCVKLSLAKTREYREDFTVTVDILPSEPFGASTLTIRGAHRDAEHFTIGADYIAAGRKPFKPPAVLCLKNQA